MNINRPFGNGRDYSVNPGDNTTDPGVVDAPVTPTIAKKVALATSSTTTASVLVSYNGTGTATNPLVARQLEARYLYVLTFLLADQATLKTQFGDEEKAARAVRNGPLTPSASAIATTSWFPSTMIPISPQRRRISDHRLERTRHRPKIPRLGLQEA